MNKNKIINSLLEDLTEQRKILVQEMTKINQNEPGYKDYEAALLGIDSQKNIYLKYLEDNE